MSAKVKFGQVVAEGKVLKWILTFVLGLAVLLLVFLGVYEGTSAIGPAAEQSVPVNSTLRAEDLEFTFGRSYVAPETVRTESALLVAKPDLKGPRRNAGAPADTSRSAILVAKPDLKGPQRSTGAPAETSRSAFPVAKPDLKGPRRYAGAPAETSRSASLVAKPDLKGPRHSTGAPAERSRSVSLVANPEIMVYRRYRLDRRR